MNYIDKQLKKLENLHLIWERLMQELTSNDQNNKSKWMQLLLTMKMRSQIIEHLHELMQKNKHLINHLLKYKGNVVGFFEPVYEQIKESRIQNGMMYLIVNDFMKGFHVQLTAKEMQLAMGVTDVKLHQAITIKTDTQDIIRMSLFADRAVYNQITDALIYTTRDPGKWPIMHKEMEKQYLYSQNKSIPFA